MVTPVWWLFNGVCICVPYYMYCTESVNWKRMNSYAYNVCSLKERNWVQHKIAPPQLGLVKTAIELRDHCDDGVYVQMSLCACHHRSSALKLQTEISSARTCRGVISHLICVVPHSFPSGNRSYRHNCLGFFEHWDTWTPGNWRWHTSAVLHCCLTLNRSYICCNVCIFSLYLHR